jgi:diguanylate cyclase (GGDEF)-like protein/putative nucleotidyltransferase with HDIG domain
LGNLPVSARVYLVAVCLGGSASILLSRLLTFPPFQARPVEILAFIIAAGIAGGKKVQLSRKAPNEEAGSMSLGFAITFASVLLFGPALAVFISAVSCLSGCLFPKRQPPHQIVFNVGLGAIEALVAGYIYIWLNGWTLQVRTTETLLAVIAASLTFYVINTFGVAAIISLCSRASPFKVWYDNFLWTAPSYFASASVGVLAMLFFRNNSAILILVAPVALLIYQSYVVYVSRAAEQETHIEELRDSHAQLAELYLATIKSLALAIDAKDQYTHQHILRVQRYAVATARQVGLTGSLLEAVNTGALLHDIGKLGVPEYVLMKPGRLTPEEFDKIKRHPDIGAAILDPVEFPWPVLPVVKHHHEKWNGTGYPDGLKGEEIPITARVMAVADVYDALTSSRSYRRAWPHERAIDYIRSEAGTHFDPQVVTAFLEVIDEVVKQMAADGEAPLAEDQSSPREGATKAAQAAIDISRASNELWALYEVAQALSCSLSTHETIEILSRKLEAIFPGVLCTFLLARKGDDALRIGAAHGLNAEFFGGGHTTGAKSLSVRVLRERKPYRGDYDPDDLMLCSSASTEWVPLRNCAIVPIYYEDEALGTINLYDPQERGFSESDLQLLAMIAERTAPALYNGLLFDRTRGDAMRDPLTGLHNVRYLTEYVNARCTEPLAGGGKGPAPFAVLCLDLDNFKPINDNFGHQKGDTVLSELADIFVRLIGKEGFVSRYGGDEFIIVLDNAGEARALEVIAALRRAVQAYDPLLLHYRLGNLQIGVSIGVALCPADGADCASLISAADADMYRNKTERKLETLAKPEPAVA